MGIDFKDENGARHLTQLKRKKQANADKTSGRSTQDNILPTPDSILRDESRLTEVLETDECIFSTPVKCPSPKLCKTPLKFSKK